MEASPRAFCQQEPAKETTRAGPRPATGGRGEYERTTDSVWSSSWLGTQTVHIPQPSKGIEHTELESTEKLERCLSSAQACHGLELYSREELDAPSLALQGWRRKWIMYCKKVDRRHSLTEATEA